MCSKILLCLLAVIVCLIDGGATNLCNAEGGEEVETIKIVDLNDDCLYETLSLLSVTDLSNLAKSNARFTPIARHLINQKILKSIEDWKAKFSSDDPSLEGDSLDLIEQCKPNDRILGDQKVVLLFKFALLITKYDFKNYLFAVVFKPKLIEAVKPYVEMSMNDENHIERYSSMLTEIDHFAILTYLNINWNKDMGWLCYAYMMILEKSNHLKGQFTFSMMQQVNKIRNQANAHYLLHPNRIDSNFTYTEKFKLDWNLYKGPSPSDDAKEMLHLALAKEEIQKLEYECKYMFQSSELLVRFARPLLVRFSRPLFARVYCSMRSLSGPNFLNLVEASKLNIAFFDLAEKDEIIAQIRNLLIIELNGSKVLENGFERQLKDLSDLIGVEEGNANDFLSLVEMESESLYQSKFVRSLESKLESLETENDFTDYIALLRRISNIKKSSNREVNVVLGRIYFTFFTFVNRPRVFDNLTQLIEVNRLHIELIDQLSTYSRTYKLSFASRKEYRALLNATFENFEQILYPTQGDTEEMRIKQRIIMKFLLVLADGAINKYELRDGVYPEETDEAYQEQLQQAVRDQLKRVMQLFYTLVSLNGQQLSQDRMLLLDWQTLNENLNRESKIFYTQRDVDAFDFVYQPYNVTNNTAHDALIYLCHLNIAENLHLFENPIPDQLLENILTLEKRIGDAEALPALLRSEILSRKTIFYGKYSDKVREKEGNSSSDLKNFIDSKIELILNQQYEDDDYFTNLKKQHKWEAEIQILQSIYEAIQNNSDVAEKQLGAKLIERLGRLSKNRQYQNVFFDKIESAYQTCKQILKF